MVFETGIPGSTFVPHLQSSILLNPDLLNPDLLNPDLLNAETHNVRISDATISTPDLLNPDLLNPDLLNPDLLNPDLLNPDLLNPDLLNPDLLNPDLLNPDLLNPDLLNPDLINPDLLNPDLVSPDLLNATLTDLTWEVTNLGSTTSTYSFNYLLSEAPRDEFKYQVLVYKSYTTPAMDRACNLVEREHHELIANVIGIRNPDLLNPDLLNPDLLNPDLLNPDLLNPDLLNPDLLNPDLLNPDLLNASLADGTFFLQPDEKLTVTMRVMDPDRTDGIDFDPTAVTPVVVAQSVNTADAEAGFRQPPIASPPSTPLTIFTTALPQATVDVQYAATLTALGGDGPVIWSIASGALPAGLALDPTTGQIGGSTAATGSFPITVVANDGVDLATRDLNVDVTLNRLTFTTQPVTTAAGSAIAPSIQVAIVDSAGNLVPTATSDLTLSIAHNAGGGSLLGTTTVTPVGGIATFANVGIDKSGARYTLLATGAGLRSDLSHAFDITGTDPSELAFGAQPRRLVVNSGFTVQVQVRDSFGNLRSDASDLVSLALGANPGGANLSGPSSVNAVGGIATFSGLALDQPGTGYTLLASAAGLAGAVSSPIDINAVPPANLAFAVQPQSTPAGQFLAPAVQVTIQDAAGNPVPTAGNSVTLHPHDPVDRQHQGVVDRQQPLVLGIARLGQRGAHVVVDLGHARRRSCSCRRRCRCPGIHRSRPTGSRWPSQ